MVELMLSDLSQAKKKLGPMSLSTSSYVLMEIINERIQTLELL